MARSGQSRTGAALSQGIRPLRTRGVLRQLAMFSGLVTQVGTLVARHALPSGQKLVIAHAFSPLELGESIATNGACLTVTSDEAVESGRRFSVDLSIETLARTTLGELAIGRRVNLERSLTLETKLGGHLVTGHVDALGEVANLEWHGEMLEVTLAIPPELRPLTAEKGSITVEGVSLTINRAARETVSLTLIPHTLQATTLGELAIGSRVNLEADLVARYVARLLEFRGA